MALTPRTMADDPGCLLIANVDESKADGAIGSVTITNRRTDKTMYLWATYSGSRIQSTVIQPGQTITQTFRGNSPRAGDVTQIGYT